LQKEFPVRVVLEDEFAPIAAIHYVVPGARKFYA
jgi:hypothetical protein